VMGPVKGRHGVYFFVKRGGDFPMKPAPQRGLVHKILR